MIPQNCWSHHHQTWHGDCLRHENDHHKFIKLTLFFVQGHTHLNRYFINFSSNAHAVKIVRLKVYLILSQSLDLAHHSRSQLCLKLDRFLTCTIVAISQTVFKLLAFKLDRMADLCMAYLFMLISMTLTLMQGHSVSAKENIQWWIILITKQARSINLATSTTVGHFLRDLDFTNVSIWLDHHGFFLPWSGWWKKHCQLRKRQ